VENAKPCLRLPIVIDADVSIDYAISDKSVLSKISKEICKVYIPLPILQEVRQLTATEVGELGLNIFEPTLRQLVEASIRGGPLSFEDKICYIIARDKKWICVTNDNNLRKKCTEENVGIAWGFDLMLWLNHEGLLSKSRAQDIVDKIKDSNKYIKPEIVTKFTEKLQ